jgi:hypothetical protein
MGWGSDSSVDDADSMAGGVASTGTATSTDMSSDDYDSMDSGIASFGPQGPSRDNGGARESVGVLTRDYKDRTYGPDYTSPDLLSNMLGPQQFTVNDMVSRGLNISPYSPNNVSFAGGLPSITVDPLGPQRVMEFDMGVPARGMDDRNVLERSLDGIKSMFDTQQQRAVQYDPITGGLTDFGGTQTLNKTSDNTIQDIIGNMIGAPFSGFTGVFDTKTYKPSVGGEAMQYGTARGGLLSGFIGDSLTPYSELNVGDPQGDSGDYNERMRLIAEAEEARRQSEQAPEEDTAITQLTSSPVRKYEYQPYVGGFYSIPSRFGLLG